MILRSPKELAVLESNSQLLVQILDSLESMFAPGTSTIEIDAAIDQRIRAVGAVPAMKNYRGFPFSSCTNINEQVTNAIPSLA